MCNCACEEGHRGVLESHISSIVYVFTPPPPEEESES